MNLATIQSEIAAIAGYEFTDRKEMIGAVSTLRSISQALRRSQTCDCCQKGVGPLLAMANALACELETLAGILPMLPLPLFGDWVPDDPEWIN